MRLSMNTKLLCSFMFLAPSMAHSEVGFRDLKIGAPAKLVYEHCEKWETAAKCYGIDDLKFNIGTRHGVEEKGASYRGLTVGDSTSTLPSGCIEKGKNHNGHYVLSCSDFHVTTDRYKIVGLHFAESEKKITYLGIYAGPLYQTLLDRVISDPNNPYVNLKNSLNSKYDMEWDHTVRDIKLFNEGESNSLWTSYNNGQVFLEIRRIDGRLHLLVHYYTESEGKERSKERKSRNANLSDF